MFEEVDHRIRALGVTSFVQILEFFARATVAVLAGAYAVGFVIVNLYLGQFGAFGAGLARVEYVTAGLLWGVLVLFGSFCAYSSSTQSSKFGYLGEMASEASPWLDVFLCW